MKQAFIREEILLGQAAMERLAAAHVAVFGIGGVGSYAVEALARSGVGELTLVDHDVIGESNLNRQLGALHSTLGQSKVQVMARRVEDINPGAQVHALAAYYSRESREQFFDDTYDYIVDAIDLVSCKIDLIVTARERGIPIISALGTGNKLDASRFRVTDISKTLNCPLARVMRKELGKLGIRHHKVVFSDELAREAAQVEAPPPGRRSVPGSVAWVPAVAGLLLAGEVVQDLIAQVSGGGGPALFRGIWTAHCGGDYVLGSV